MQSVSAITTKAKSMWPIRFLKESMVNVRLVVIGLIGVALLLAGSFFDNTTVKPKADNSGKVLTVPVTARTYEEVLESKLANILSQVKGAGAVAVNITLEGGTVHEHARNIVKETKTIQEKDTAGGIRTTTENKQNEQILLGKENGMDRPVTVQEIRPVIKGVLVIADGAYDSAVKASLTKAVATGLGIPAYKVTVLPQRK